MARRNRIGLSDLNYTPEQIAAMGPEEAQTIVDLITILNGGTVDDRPRDPVSGAIWDYPLTADQCACINHASLARSDYGRKALAEMDCGCDFCLHWRRSAADLKET